MPKEFTDCVERGGRVRTKRVKKDRYVRICFDEAGSHAGEVKRKKSARKR